MNLIPDKMGGSRKQVMWLVGLTVVLVVVYLSQREPSSPTVTVPVKPAAPVARQGPAMPESSFGPKMPTRSNRKADDFRPSLKLPDGIDVTKIDPTLKIDLLAKLQKVPLEGGSRSVFDWGQAPVPPPPHVDPIKPEVLKAQAKAREEQEIKMAEQRKTIKPPAPPIPLKFYGYANRLSGPARQAFFLDGDDIHINGENDVIRGRYKIIRIGINSATVEDLQNHDQQTLPLVAEQNS
jgi:hypothetical protein